MKNYILGSILTFLLFSCKEEIKINLSETEEKLMIVEDTIQTTCPYLTSDHNGNIVMSWVKELNDSDAVMCYATSKDHGFSFGQPIEIPTSKDVHPHGENLPKVIFKPTGEIIAMWGASNANPKNKYSGLVSYSQSFDGGKTWTEPKPLVTDTTSYDQRYFDMALLPNGEIAVIWLDNRTKTDAAGSTLYYAETKARTGFQNEKVIGETCCQCCRTDLFVDNKGNIHAAYRDIINDTIRDMVHTVSFDKGKTFSTPERISEDNWVISGCPHTGPTMTENKNGMQFAWHTMGGGNGVFFTTTKDNGRNFSSRDTVSTQASAKHAQLATLSNDHTIIVWDENIKYKENTNVVIGIQDRDGDGKILRSKKVSSPAAVSEFPTIKSLDENFVLVAWTQRIPNEKIKSLKQVYYRIVKVN